MSDKDNNLSIEELLESLEKSKQAFDSELEAHHTQMVDYSQKETPRSTQELQVSQPAQTAQSVQPETEAPKVSEVQPAAEILKVSEMQPVVEAPKVSEVQAVIETPKVTDNQPSPEMPKFDAVHGMPMFEARHTAPNKPEAVQGADFVMTEPAAPSPVPEDDSPFISVEPAVGSGSSTGYKPAAGSGSTGGYGMPGDNSAAAAHRGSTGGYGMPSENSSTAGPSVAPRSKASRRREKKPLQITKAGFVLSLILAMLLTSLLSFGAMAAYSKYMSGSDKEAATYTLSQSNDNLDYKSIIAKSQDAVVSIVTESVTMDLWAQNYVTQGAGSGVVIKENGYIITCNHVVEGAKKITVTLRNKKSYEAELVGADPGNDVAVLKIDAEGLSAAEYGDSSKLVMGDPVVAIGNPLGHLSDTASAGIISSLNRELSIEGQSLNLLQTDASINPGNSGGGLFNASGNLIGVVVAKSTGSDVEGLGFAIPINRAAKIASKIIKTGGNVSEGQSGGDNNTKSRVVIGINIVELSDQDAAQYGYESGGVFITGVTSSGAMEAGLQSGDKLEEVDGTKVENSDQLSELLSKHKAGDKVEVLVLRGQGEYRTTVTLSSTIDE